MIDFQHFLGAGHDSESDNDDYDQEASPEAQINPYWFEQDDAEENSTRDVRLLSKSAKSLNEIEQLVNNLTLSFYEKSWPEALKQFQVLKDAVDKHKEKYGIYAPSYLEFLSFTKFEEEKDKTKDDFSHRQQFNSLKKLMQSVEEESVSLKAMIDALDEEEEEGEEDEMADSDSEEETHDEIYYKELLSKWSFVLNRSLEPQCRKVVAECKALEFSSTEISASSFLITVYLLVDSGKLSVPLARWRRALDLLENIYTNVCERKLIVVESFSAASKGSQVTVVGGFHGMLRNFWDNLRKTQYNLDSTGKDDEFLSIPELENKLLDLANSMSEYYTSRSQMRNAFLCNAVILEIVGFRRPAGHQLLFSKLTSGGSVVSEDLIQTIQNVMNFPFPPTKMAKMVSVCYLAYQLAMKGLYREGRDTLLRAGVRDFIDSAKHNESCMALATTYNRAVAQLGLAGFVAGDMYEAYQLLGGIWSHDFPEVLLGQKAPYVQSEVDSLRYMDNMVPIHLHIPYQHLELAAMLSALVIDTTKEAKNPYDRNQREHQKFFYQAISKKIPLMGSANSTHERVGAAYRALKKGDFNTAKQHIADMPAWNSLSNGASAREMYLNQLKEAALRIFCITNRCNFSSFSVSTLALKYDMQESAVKESINHIISENDSLIAYWDRDEEYLYVDRSNLTRLQHLVTGTTHTASLLNPYTERRLRTTEGRGRGRGRGRMDLRK